MFGLIGAIPGVLERRGASPVVAIRDLENFDPARLATPGTDVFVIGGAEIYAQLLPRCAELLLTLLPRDVEGDACFPAFEELFECRETVLVHPEFEVRRYVRNATQ